MTANEKAKAKELVSKFENHTSTEFDEADEGNYRAIQCALICVDEILKTFFIASDTEREFANSNDYTFWQLVKKEINNL